MRRVPTKQITLITAFIAGVLACTFAVSPVHGDKGFVLTPPDGRDSKSPDSEPSYHTGQESTEPDALPCDADFTGDKAIDIEDLVFVAMHWGACPDGCPADLNADKSVDEFDLIEVIINWGTCP